MAFTGLTVWSGERSKALDCSVAGSMNDLINHAKVWLAEGELSPFDVGSGGDEPVQLVISPDSGCGVVAGRDRIAYPPSSPAERRVAAWC
jgi:hypothetical protein